MDWSGFHRRGFDERLAMVRQHAGLTDAEVATLAAALPREASDAFIENAAGSFALPLGFAVGFSIDGQATVVPMAVEESSVVAAASHGAKLAGDIITSGGAPVTVGQIEVRDPRRAPDAGELNEWKRIANDTMPNMVARGGGVVDITSRESAGRTVIHVAIDTQDAMGANVVNTACETLGPPIAAALGGRLGLRILSNHAPQAAVTAEARVPIARLGVADAMVEANEFAVADPFRAATHNKGILNGIDPVVIATGNDWRAVEAGAHAYAASSGPYRPLTHYEIDGEHLVARLTLPIRVGTVGGVTRLHPTARTCLKILGSPSGQRLSQICAAVGLAQNLSALRALSAEGIQAGHMRLHATNAALSKESSKNALADESG